MNVSKHVEPWVLRLGRWLTKRRSILLAPLFTVTVFSARWAPNLTLEILMDGFGLLLLFLGARLRFVAASYHETERSGEPITAGPYAWVRHPLYLANFMLGLGIVLLAGWLPMIVFYVLFFLPVHWFVARSEELHLLEIYGDKYRAYRNAVPAILPLRASYAGPRSGTRSGMKLVDANEKWKTAGYLLGAALLLSLKQWRHLLPVPELQPIPMPGMVLAAAVALSAIVLRTRTKPAWLKTVGTVITVISILLMASHVPGIWTAPNGPARYAGLKRIL